MENDSYMLRMKNYDTMAFGGKKWKQLMKCSGWVKRIFTIKTIMKGWHQARTMNLEENGARYGGKILLRSSNVENDDERDHHALLRYSGRMNIRKVEPTMKRI